MGFTPAFGKSADKNDGGNRLKQGVPALGGGTMAAGTVKEGKTWRE
jgi:hypothetical protein